jgi:DNA-binding response OmpR family regulator
MRILIIEDEVRIANNIKDVLSSLHYSVDIALSASEAINYAEVEDYDVIILDWMLPDMDGILVCNKLRAEKIDTPILFLTAKAQIEDKVQGLNAGADDYLTKPFSMDELVARIKALIRRKSDSRSPIINVADITINTNTHEVMRGKRAISLSPKEYLLLEYLVLNKGKALNRMDILSHVWGDEVDAFSNTVDVHIRYLRKKLDDTFSPKVIKTVKGTGYMILDL